MRVDVITVLHPGAMGAVVGQVAGRGGVRVQWCPDGRGAATRARAERAGLHPVGSLVEALASSSLVVSVCPPAAAEAVAIQVHDAAGPAGFRGVFVEANAISPQRAARVAARLGGIGIGVADAGIIGPPPRRVGSTRLYVSGEAAVAGVVAEVFGAGALEVVVLDRPVGAASGLKLAYASYQKSRRALAAVAHALAAHHDVSSELLGEAERMGGALADLDGLSGAAARAWRWAPEMGEAADALVAAGLPADLATAAAAVLRCWDEDKDRSDLGTGEVLDRLRRPG